MTAALAAVEVLTCGRCGCDWTRRRKNGPKPLLCPQCPPEPPPPAAVIRTGGGVRNVAAPGVDVSTAAYRVAASAVTYRLAIEQATALLRLGRHAEALAVLERVEAPTRHG